MSLKDKEMTARPANNKKWVETVYVEEACHASTLFPVGRLEPQEIPDFVLFTEHRKIGIEVTELCREAPRAETGHLSKSRTGPVRSTSGPQAEPVDVNAAFWRAESVHFNALTKSLADFVYANRTAKGTGFKTNLPKGFCQPGRITNMSAPQPRSFRILHSSRRSICASSGQARRVRPGSRFRRRSSAEQIVHRSKAHGRLRLRRSRTHLFATAR